MRKPEEIKELSSIQVDAYYHSFLRVLDESNERVTDWESGFLESCLRRVSFTEPQKEVIRNLMDKYPKRTPRYEHYKTYNHAETYLFG